VEVLAYAFSHSEPMHMSATLDYSQGITFILYHLKKFLVRLLVLTWKFFALLKQFLSLLYAITLRASLLFVGRFLFRHILLRFYKLYLPLSHKFKVKFFINHNRFLYIATHRFLIHALFILIALAVATHNLRAQEIQSETVGQKSLLTTLTTGENEFIIETAETQETPASYVDTSGFIVYKTPNLADDIDFDIVNDTEVAETGGALVKTNIPTTETTPGGARQYDDILYHIVSEGETTSEIAEQYGITTHTLLWENKLGTKDLIRPGQKLTILPSDGVSHRITSGDTIESISKKYAASAEEIINYNALANASAIREGDILIIPDGTPPAPPTPRITPPAPKSRLARVREILSDDEAPAGSSEKKSGLIWPTRAKRLSQYFGYRHSGIDIDGGFGDAVWAADSGVVATAGWDGGYGIRVVVNHGDGIQTLYAHLQKTYVKTGQSVDQGQTLGEQGSTGRSTGAHLHFEVRINGRTVNPLHYVK